METPMSDDKARFIPSQAAIDAWIQKELDKVSDSRALLRRRIMSEEMFIQMVESDLQEGEDRLLKMHRTLLEKMKVALVRLNEG